MKDYFDGWEDRENMQIPEREKEGFQEKVIVRKPVVPIREKKQPEEDGYVPRPAWQVWAARAGLIIVLILVAVQILTIAGGGG